MAQGRERLTVSYNLMSAVKAALLPAHGEEGVEGVSFYYLTNEVAGTHRGRMTARPEDRWGEPTA